MTRKISLKKIDELREKLLKILDPKENILPMDSRADLAEYHRIAQTSSELNAIIYRHTNEEFISNGNESNITLASAVLYVRTYLSEKFDYTVEVDDSITQFQETVTVICTFLSTMPFIGFLGEGSDL